MVDVRLWLQALSAFALVPRFLLLCAGVLPRGLCHRPPAFVRAPTRGSQGPSVGQTSWLFVFGVLLVDYLFASLGRPYSAWGPTLDPTTITCSHLCCPLLAGLTGLLPAVLPSQDDHCSSPCSAQAQTQIQLTRPARPLCDWVRHAQPSAMGATARQQSARRTSGDV